jgi:hypothetical protein
MLFKPLNKKVEENLRKYDKAKSVVFISQSAANMCWSRFLCKFVLEKGHVPVNYFTVFNQFIYEIADQSTMIDSINSLIIRCDELWTFGEISEGMWFEVKMCKELGMPVKHFNIHKLPREINEITEKQLEYQEKFLKKMKKYKKFTPIHKLLIHTASI